MESALIFYGFISGFWKFKKEMFCIPPNVQVYFKKGKFNDLELLPLELCLGEWSSIRELLFTFLHCCYI